MRRPVNDLGSGNGRVIYGRNEDGSLPFIVYRQAVNHRPKGTAHKYRAFLVFYPPGTKIAYRGRKPDRKADVKLLIVFETQPFSVEPGKTFNDFIIDHAAVVQPGDYDVEQVVV